MKIDIELEDQTVLDALNQLQSAGGDLTPAMREIAGLLADESEQAFEDEADPATGEPWPDLAESTKKQRTKKGKWPGKKLQVSAGGLAPSIHSEYGSDFAAAGTNKIYGAIHQFGGQAGRNHAVTIPARPFLGLSDEGESEVLEIVNGYLEMTMK